MACGKFSIGTVAAIITDLIFMLQVRVVRIFNTYGPRMALDDGRVVSNFLTQALTGKPLTIYGDGQQTRSFQYISDLIAGMLPLSFQDHKISRRERREIVALTRKNEISRREV